MKSFGIVNIETGEFVDNKSFSTLKDAKLSLRHNGWNKARFGVAEVETIRTGQIYKYNKEEKKWEVVQ